eukprot:7460007-Alexandrium_andersonii.AAC.1
MMNVHGDAGQGKSGSSNKGSGLADLSTHAQPGRRACQPRATRLSAQHGVGGAPSPAWGHPSSNGWGSGVWSEACHNAHTRAIAG